MLSRRLAAAFALGLTLTAVTIVGCAFVDPNPPSPHGDGGDDEADPLTAAHFDGGIVDGGQEAGQ